jgi:hypothetical protein
MDPVTLTLVPGILGGLVVAWLLSTLYRRRPDALPVPHELAISTDAINIAHIRAAGLGGLGMLAMAFVVALFVPGVRVAVGAGLLFGVVLAGVLIVRRRRTDPLPSSGGSAGANVILSIEHPGGSTGDEHGKSGQPDTGKLKSAAVVA